MAEMHEGRPRWGRLDPWANEGMRECDYHVRDSIHPNCVRQPRWRDRKDYRGYCTEHKQAILAHEKAKAASIKEARTEES